MLTSRILVLSAIGGALAVSPAYAGNVYVQIQCGSPPEIAATSHSVALRGSFSPDTSSSRWLVPLAGQVDVLHVDGTALTVSSPEIEDGFLETEELGRIFLTVSDQAPGYGAVLMDSQIEKLERVDR